MKSKQTLQERLEIELSKYDNPHQLAQDIGVNYGLIWRVLHGGESPLLRRKFKIPKHPPRPRLIINCPPAAIARFHRARGDITTGAYLEVLLDAADGVGTVDY